MRIILTMTSVFLWCFIARGGDRPLVDWVNTLQGTNSHHELTRGNTYPTTALPFAMHTWTPQTGNNGDGWKYQYQKDTIRGFQQAHQCSSWTNDYAVFSLMPISGELEVNEHKRASKFSHDHETARPNYYQVKFDNGINTEISPSWRGAHIRFSFPQEQKAFIVLDGYTTPSMVNIDPDNCKITGYVKVTRGRKPNFFNHFVLTFDQPFVSCGTWENRGNTIEPGAKSREGRGAGAYLEFAPGTVVQVKVASSYISLEQAHLNLDRELGAHADLEATRAAAGKVWNDHLGRIAVSGGSDEDMATFYSCFFRASLFSRMFHEFDADNEPYYFSPYDARVHKGKMYTDTGFWDTFRAQFPLTCILHPTMQGEYMLAMLAAYEQCGWLPSWSFPGEEGSMVGNHAISLFADAWSKGIRTFDPQKALAAYHHEANNKGPWGPANGRDGYKYYYELGYVPYPEVREATAKTLEYAYDDFCGWYLAKAVGDEHYQQLFAPHMFNYKNVFNPETGFMQGKNAKGQWQEDFSPFRWGGPYTEGNAWHYTWSVFHDVYGLIELMGGDAAFNAKLDAVFSAPNTVDVGTYGGMIHEMTEMVMADMGQYAHGNQPIQHMVYLYNYSGEPWKAQYHARNVMAKLYNATENGYPGDEDQGQTSSWYVLSALGFYSVCPGTDEYVIGSPVFPHTVVTMENGKKFIIDAVNNSSENVYIQSATLNGEPFTRNFLTYAEIVNGGELRLVMGSEPAKDRGISPADRPYSVSKP